jgi:hypothetical protein
MMFKLINNSILCWLCRDTTKDDWTARLAMRVWNFWIDETDSYFSRPELKTMACRRKVLIKYITDNMELIEDIICDNLIFYSYKGIIRAKITEVLLNINSQYLYWTGHKPYINVLICSRDNLCEKLHSEYFGYVWEKGASKLVYMDPLDLLKFNLEKLWQNWNPHESIVVLQPPHVDTIEGLEYLQKVTSFLQFLEDNPSFNLNEANPLVLEAFYASFSYLTGTII